MRNPLHGNRRGVALTISTRKWKSAFGTRSAADTWVAGRRDWETRDRKHCGTRHPQGVQRRHRRPQGDVELFSKSSAWRLGRLNEIMLLTNLADYSLMLTLSHYYGRRQWTMLFQVCADEDYYISVATAITQAIVEALVLMAKYRC